MCGRYTHLYTWKQLHRLLGLTTTPPDETPPRYNVAPTQDAPVVRQDESGQRSAAMLRWGLVPRWADDASIGGRMVNARAETAATKPAFREALRRRRCLIPASGFYEWRAIPGLKRKQPFYIRPRDAEVFAFAGLWEQWERRGDGPGGGGGGEGAGPLETFTILTTAANDLMWPIHDRMPVILPPEKWGVWLDPRNEDVGALEELMVPAAPGAMELYPVSTRVNAPAHDDERCIEPADEGSTSGPASLWEP